MTTKGPDSAVQRVRLRTAIRGAVQGVGFRPFVFRLANQLGLTGWINNSPQGVLLEAEGRQNSLEIFLRRLALEKPPRSFIQSQETSWLDPVGYCDFVIRESDAGGPKTALVMPDIATCPDCLAEIFNPRNRRYLYPFTNCTSCGPRFSIIEALPYDRSNTSMKRFVMCPECQAEYDNPEDRRFHAQPNACHLCGPWLELWGPSGEVLARPGLTFESNAGELKSCVTGPPENSTLAARENCSLAAAADAIRTGQIVAVKGIGGFHLLVSARDERALAKLRERKHREEKPFAVMFPSMEAVRNCCEMSPLEDRLLQSPEAPIVILNLLPLPRDLSVSSLVAPANPSIGAVLPYTPLHHLLLGSLQFPVVATSGNLQDEPICTDEREAIERLAGIADLFLVHNRPIVRHVDDSIARVMVDRELVLRRARGYAPLPIEVRNAECGVRNEEEEAESADGKGATFNTPHSSRFTSHSPLPIPDSPLPFPHSALNPLRTPHSEFRTVLAVGAHLKNAIALGVGPQVFISQHIGDLETTQATDAFLRVTRDLQSLYDSPAMLIAADAHPAYYSTQFAQAAGLPCLTVQHHVAHVLSCMAENDLEPPVLGVSWDGTGYGLDGTVWGGEFFRINDDGYERVAHFRQFPLPGGEQAIKEPRRSGLGLLFALFGEAAFRRSDLKTLGAFSATEAPALKRMLSRRINTPLTSSVGRLFDGVASLLDVRQRVYFEGQAAIDLEFLLKADPDSAAYEVTTEDTSPIVVLDWQRGIEAILEDLQAGLSVNAISARFHNMLVEAVLKIARRTGMERVALSGGCFQNRYLTEQTVRRLRQAGFRPYWHQRVPPNDGGICLGQVVAARWWKV